MTRISPFHKLQARQFEWPEWWLSHFGSERQLCARCLHAPHDGLPCPAAPCGCPETPK